MNSRRRPFLFALLVVAMAPLCMTRAQPVDTKVKAFVVVEIQSVRIALSGRRFDRKNWQVNCRVQAGGDPAAHGFNVGQDVVLHIHSPVMTFGATDGLAGRRFAITYLSAPKVDYSGIVTATAVPVEKEK